MDEMKFGISTRFMRSLLSKIIGRMIYKQTGYKVNVYIKEIVASYNNEKASLHANIDANMNKDEFIKLMKSIAKID